MDNIEKQKILANAKKFFKERIIDKHIVNTKKCEDLSNFNVNPFLHKYLAQYAFGDSSPQSMAKALIYPRILGTSINTSFGTNMQYFCNEVLSSYASTTSGIDIEFVDCIDGRKKYAQIKSGPNFINKDDIKTITGHFKSIHNLARANKLQLNTTDCIVCVIYGKKDELNDHYKKINEYYPVYVGQDFWFRLTGDKEFYNDIINAFVEAGNDADSTKLINEVIDKLARKIEKAYDL